MIMDKQIIFILSSLNDSHFRKRVEEFLDNGYEVKVYGFKRKGQNLPELRYTPIILGEIENRNFKSRLSLFNKQIKGIAKECNGLLCFFSSLDIALFAKLYIKAPYIYEVCDLTELTIGNPIIRTILTKINESVIKKSQKTIITSEGFSEYFAELPSDKFYLIPNKVSADMPMFADKGRKLNMNKIRIGFAGVIRFESIYHFIKACADYGKNVEMHLFGIYSDADEWAAKIEEIEKKSENVFFHGRFSNPSDLPSIYDSIDLVLCTYPPTLGVKYAEPNKLYEAIYFRCPIIVSEKVFLGDKVRRLNIGYVIDAMDEHRIKDFLNSLDGSDYASKVEACKAIPQSDCLNVNKDFFKEIENL
jgi:glycosyltransferase involved in cell wall biosynthesis